MSHRCRILAVTMQVTAARVTAAVFMLIGIVSTAGAQVEQGKLIPLDVLEEWLATLYR